MRPFNGGHVKLCKILNVEFFFDMDTFSFNLNIEILQNDHTYLGR